MYVSGVSWTTREHEAAAATKEVVEGTSRTAPRKRRTRHSQSQGFKMATRAEAVSSLLTAPANIVDQCDDYLTAPGDQCGRYLPASCSGAYLCWADVTLCGSQAPEPPPPFKLCNESFCRVPQVTPFTTHATSVEDVGLFACT